MPEGEGQRLAEDRGGWAKSGAWRAVSSVGHGCTRRSDAEALKEGTTAAPRERRAPLRTMNRDAKLKRLVKPHATLGMLSANPAHRSFFRERLTRLAGARGLEDWLLEEANVRGHLGAVGTSVPERDPTRAVSDADLIVALLMPHNEVDGRLFKLVVRMLQRAPIDPQLLWFHARRERADRVLYWLLNLVPEAERTERLGALMAACPAQPRGYVGLRFNYANARLLRRPATKESVWRAARR
jgi:hypothetical protein